LDSGTRWPDIDTNPGFGRHAAGVPSEGGDPNGVADATYRRVADRSGHRV